MRPPRNRRPLERAKPRKVMVPGLAARQVSARFYRAVVFEGASLDALFDAGFGDAVYHDLIVKDRALVRAIVSTALRRRQSILAVLSHLMERPLPKQAKSVEAILAIGAVQILYMDIPDHASVSLCVELAEQSREDRPFKGLVNAVLRRMIREKERLLPFANSKSNLPEWLASRWRVQYGADKAAAMADMMLQEPPLDISVKSDHETWAEAFEGYLLSNGTIRLAKTQPVRALPGFEDGAWWIQDAAATLPVLMMGDIAGQKVIDLCAAPGGKTAQLVNAGAQVTALDFSSERLQRLEANLKRLSLQADLHKADAGRWKTDALYDGVLLDAPCSSTGTLRRHPDIVFRKSEDDVKRMAMAQERLLNHAATLVKPGGILVYSTCSLEAEEGEDQIETFLARNSDFRIEKLTPDMIGGLEEAITREGWLRTLPIMLSHENPQLSGLDGFFAVRLRRIT
jgi:16S rRNA (cytosine967-C5)-methyltransferase